GAAHAVPSEEAAEIAGAVEDAALEAAQEAAESPTADTHPETAAVAPGGEGHAAPTEQAMEIAGVAEDAPLEALQEAEDHAAEEEEEQPPRVKPSVPGAHLEVDIVPEGVDPLGRIEEEYVDPYAIEDQEEAGEAEAAEEPDRQDEALSEPIATAAIDLAAGARYRATGKRKT